MRLIIVSGTMTLRPFALLLALLLPLGAIAQEKVVNIYSSRHYQTDEALYSGFTKLTGIKVNRIEAGEDALIERIRNEGARSPADVFITVDAGRLWRAQELGLFQPVRSSTLESRIPASFREPGGHWYGFSMRARILAFNKARVRPDELRSYESLADPKWKGRICVRSSTNIYNLSLMGALIDRLGEAKAQEWANAVRANMARPPKGGDTDQIKAVASGECGVAISNTYYIARLVKSSKADEKEVMEKVKVVFPNQGTTGTHVNIAGAAVAKHAKNKDNAIAFMEYLASPYAQDYFANGNNEFAAAKGVKIENAALKAIGGDNFKAEQIPLGVVAKNMVKVQQMLDRVGFK